ncbi:hypothetical protein [Mycobacterium sp. SMC-4]|uniref:hypothetical protein n=1 Tax=Mycobacterium sp. SMC-4 TaxID=2857059 RepID=UPI003D0410B3
MDRLATISPLIGGLGSGTAVNLNLWEFPRSNGLTGQPYATGYNIAAVIAGTTPIPQK